MSKLFTMIAAAATLTATAAQAEPKRFQADGLTYEYETQTDARGATVLVGRTLEGGSFRLVVKNGQVRGTANGQPVSFSVADSRGAAGRARPVEIASR
ncbi:hypothetical protein SAMN06297144_1990 [Sphingomonas guangdongensis]|uniref:Uncharacterized protein n=1 Tax=Sphingomonas guangdongensis TaxID=1141890 RepID=A0A285QZR7_9SPHN|nr:hypothetical protein [Sphingomonas guangdongensis]SOB86879.1 hypothetical protein SAMN06297144_1990 [Sphingomonas guangdongensis]